MKIESYFAYEKINNWIEKYENNYRTIASVERIGYSDEGRDIKAVHVTNNSVPISDKEIALIIIGRHGDELGTRVVGPAVLEWLASEAAQKTRDRQHIIVVPVANPDVFSLDLPFNECPFII